MAGKDEFVSVLEKGDMASPAYRRQVAKEQELENVYPETWGLQTLAKGAIEKGVGLARGLRNVAFPERNLAGTVTGSPHMDALAHEIRGPATSSAGVQASMDKARDSAALGQMTQAQYSDFALRNVKPANWDEMQQSASAIGAYIGKGRAWKPDPSAQPAARELFFKMYDPVEEAALKRMRNVDLPLAVADHLDRRANNNQAAQYDPGLRSRYGSR